MSVVPELRTANERYSSTFAHTGLAAPPARRFAVVTCMDARLDPAAFLGLAVGDAHVIRNAGGLVTEDALRSLVISHWHLGTQEAVVVAHEGCGMLTFTNPDFRRTLEEATGHDASAVDFLPFDDLDGAVRASLQRIRENPFLPDSYGASGFVYDIATGAMREVPEEEEGRG
jgi:carbonic anhydrase